MAVAVELECPSCGAAWDDELEVGYNAVECAECGRGWDEFVPPPGPCCDDDPDDGEGRA